MYKLEKEKKTLCLPASITKQTSGLDARGNNNGVDISEILLCKRMYVGMRVRTICTHSMKMNILVNKTNLGSYSQKLQSAFTEIFS